MNKTPNSNRTHIGLFGKTNSGKSTIFNGILGQDMSIVSDISGTTTDSVSKAMEFLPFGPVLFIDTAGFEDRSELGQLREEKTRLELKKCDYALLVMDSKNFDDEFYNKMRLEFKKYNIPFILVLNKEDLLSNEERKNLEEKFPNGIFTKGDDFNSILKLKEKLLELLDSGEEESKLIGDLLPYGSKVVMVIPIDSEAPKGRLILPQVQLLRECLDSGIKSYVVRDTELEEALEDIKDIDLVVTDSQIFKKVKGIVGDRFKLTSFSILFARQKGDLKSLVEGAEKLEKLEDGDKILIAETCTHNTSHEDIGRVKIPRLVKKYTGKNVEFVFKGGKDYPENLDDFALVIHCGGCMINRKNMQTRMNESLEKNVPITNYGVIIAYINGILKDAIEIFK